MGIKEKLFVGDKPIEDLEKDELIKEIQGLYGKMKSIMMQNNQMQMIISQLQMRQNQRSVPGKPPVDEAGDNQ